MGARVPATWLLLPGLDGTGRLFAPLLKCLPEGLRAQVVGYPTDRPSRAAELLALIEAALPCEDFVIVAESFSGPLALRLAAGKAPRLRAVVLCASFGELPAPKLFARFLSLLVRAVHLKVRTPDWVLRDLLLERGSDDLVLELREALRSVSAPALASRCMALAEFDSYFVPSEIDIPTLYLRATRDQIIGGREVLQLKRQLRSLSIEEIEAPHLVLQCRPELAVEAICRFLERLD